MQMTKRYAHLCVSHKQKLIEEYFGEIYVELMVSKSKKEHIYEIF